MTTRANESNQSEKSTLEDEASKRIVRERVGVPPPLTYTQDPNPSMK